MERKNYFTLKACLIGTLSLTYTMPQVSACGSGLFPTYLNDRLFDSDMKLDFTKDLELIIKKLNLKSEYFIEKKTTTTAEADKNDFFFYATEYKGYETEIRFDADGNMIFIAVSAEAKQKEKEQKELQKIAPKLYEKFVEQRINNTVISDQELKKIPLRLQEFFLYANGVAQIKKDPKLTFPKAWKQLLSLAPKYKTSRSTWVYYMLGNLHFKNNQEEAGRQYYKKLRNIGYFSIDSLGLEYASYRSEAFYCKNIVNKLNAYLIWYIVAKENNNIKDSQSAINEMQYIATKSFNKLNEEQKKTVLKDPVTRELVLLASYPPENIIKLLPKDCEIISTGRLAWLAFREGKVAICKKYLQYLKPLSPNRLWLEARILRSEKKYSLAAEKIKLFLKNYHHNRDIKDCFFPKNDIIDDAYGVLGSSLIYRYFGYIDYNKNKSLQEVAPEILYAFFKADSWVDVDYVAERLIKLKDLQAFCDNHAVNPEISLHQSLRNTLARRLMRAYKFSIALKYFDPELKVKAKTYIEMFQKANDSKRSNKERATTFYNLALFLHARKSNILGTALFPDYSQCGRWSQSLTRRLDCYKPIFYYKITANKVPRFYQHHNVLASSYLARAANLIDDKNFKAVCLFLAGSFIKVKHPDLADNYFKQLCDMRPHQLAVEANKKNWFPTYNLEEVTKKFNIDNIIK